MASVGYLWKNRAKFHVWGIDFYRAWAKRILTFQEVVERNSRRTKLIRSGAVIDETSEIGVIKTDGNKGNLVIEANSILGRVELALHDQIKIGKNVCINDGVKLLSGSHNINDPVWGLIKKPIFIDDYVWIATNAIILPGVSIGKGAVIGAGAVVSRNVEPFSIMVGNPAKPLSKKRDAILKYNPCKFLAGNRAWLVG
ncbi:acyltransferase [Salegentibacter sp. JZCK2]|uniref:acyltransferase n=1 Tax=Salegentibacter tibetensis TaxID=2873600 RepID=UPI001CCA1B97|nr:acyltransferase [Salegentibacter tibetensis]MBZ9731294.1 acyltransferase [Salegentibacter tibetensis]